MKYPTNPDLIAALVSLRGDLGLTNNQLAQKLGINGASPTYLSKYINDNLDREVPGFESSAFDAIRAIRERVEFDTSVFQTSVTRRIGKCLDLIRRTGDIALITSPAGNGKTSAISAYLRENLTTVAITCTAVTRSGKKVEGLVFDAVDHRQWGGYTSRFSYLVERFRGSARLLIVDNAQRLDASGRQWLFDFHDAADCPICLVGNPETLDAIRANDQQFSRIGIHAMYSLEKQELHAAASRVATQFSDAATSEQISDLCAFIADHAGRLRAVRKTVILAQELRSASADLRDNPRKAIRAAHSRLVRDYELPLD